MRYDRQGRRCAIFNTNDRQEGDKEKEEKGNHTPENSLLLFSKKGGSAVTSVCQRKKTIGGELILAWV